MKRLSKIFFIVLLFQVLLQAQGFKFGFITDTHIGSPNADRDLEIVVNDINQRPEIKFVVATGDIAEKGLKHELSQAKDILDQLDVPYYIIPGNHDTKWTESGGNKFKELWGDDKFAFEYEDIKFIGINSGILWRGGGGHISSEDLNWLNNILGDTPKEQEIIFMVHHPLNFDIDNWFKVTNLLRDHNIKVVLHGHGHGNKIHDFNGIPAAMGRSSLDRGGSWGYGLIQNTPDSLIFTEINNKGIARRPWGIIDKRKELTIPQIDSTQFINYDTDIIWQKNLNYTVSPSLLVYEEKIYSATRNGIVSCFDLKGNELWKYETRGTIFSRPAASNNILAVATIEGDLITFNASTGEFLLTIGHSEALTSQLITIEIDVDGRKTIGIVTGTENGNLYCYDLFSLNLIWENNNAEAMIETLPLFIDNKLIYGSWDNYLYCINAQNGLLNWRWTENKNFYYSPAAHHPVTDGSKIFVSTPDKFISAVDLLLGTTTWRKNDFESWESIGISRDKSKLLIKSFMNNFYIVSAKDGKLIRKIDLQFGLDTMPITPIEWNGNIIFGAKNGIVYLIDKDYKFKKLFFAGTARLHSVQHVKENIFAASNMDGKIILFSVE